MAEKYIKASDCEKYFYEHLDDLHMAGAMNAIDEMPNADVVLVKLGHWINENFYTRCSVCGNMAIYDRYGQEVESDYCPRCGAKMDKKQNANAKVKVIYMITLER